MHWSSTGCTSRMHFQDLQQLDCWRNICACSFYAGVLHFDELSKLKLCDITIYEDHESSKTDQLRQETLVVVSQ